jgi:hypothetical protein
VRPGPSRSGPRRWRSFFAIAQIFGALGPAFFGALIGDGSSRSGLVLGYVVGGMIMVARWRHRAGLRDQGRGTSVETVTKPLTAVSAETVEEGASDE